MIDGHVHVWTLDARKYPWQQTLAHVPIPNEPAEAETLIAEMDDAGITHAVLVQPSVYGWDNAYLCDCLVRWPSRFVGVCLVNPRGRDAADKLSYWVKERGCGGVRVNLIGEGNVDWALAPEREGLWYRAHEFGISVSLQMRPQHARLAARLASLFPSVIFIVDYLGPDAFHDGSGFEALDQLSALENVWYKIITLGPDSRRPFPFDDLWPLYKHAFLRFGTGRLVFGTDFPHIYKACSYRAGIDWLEALPFLSPAARRAIGEDNAKALWGIGRDAASRRAGNDERC